MSVCMCGSELCATCSNAQMAGPGSLIVALNNNLITKVGTMHTPWLFFAIAATTPSGFTWQWQKKADRTLTSGHFDFYFDCVADARANGYTGPLPTGPKVPWSCVADTPVEAKAVSTAAQPSHAGSKNVVMAVRPM